MNLLIMPSGRRASSPSPARAKKRSFAQTTLPRVGEGRGEGRRGSTNGRNFARTAQRELDQSNRSFRFFAEAILLVLNTGVVVVTNDELDKVFGFFTTTGLVTSGL